MLAVVIGLCVNGSIPLYFELACEYAYPVHEGLAGACSVEVNMLCSVLYSSLYFVPTLSRGKSLYFIPANACYALQSYVWHVANYYVILSSQRSRNAELLQNTRDPL